MKSTYEDTTIQLKDKNLGVSYIGDFFMIVKFFGRISHTFCMS